MNKQNEKLLKKAYILLAIGFIGVIILISGELRQQESVLYNFIGAVAMLCAICAGMISFYLVGYNDATLNKKVGK